MRSRTESKATATSVVAVMSNVTSEQGATAREQSGQRALTLADSAVSERTS